ncbi:hypothetical protein M2281_002025 [Mesorhizobium soli]|uniref:hypothetical protein n=1 Tax=Pseudaminobacter soli (ex Li et al. 2025) TaxID=1295366 RepID=UPI002475F1A7|nr:hypothetical protein [Mesorhizobium soli]MDH6231453.1 hypothetical protein [Mesorhizobium soli]
MQKNRSKNRLLPVLLACVFAGGSLPAVADGYTQDDVYADSFGNLIVNSAAGYKRIIVGQGHNASKLSNYIHPKQSKMAYSGGYGASDCYQPYYVKGRSYMYGFYQGAMPLLGLPCR